jgi:hypothetical protein
MATSRPSLVDRSRADGSHYRSITPLEAIYYHERLDLVTHPLIKGASNESNIVKSFIL